MGNYSQKERDLIDILENELDFAAMRAPASGGATDRELPDIIAGRGVPDELLDADGDFVDLLYSAYDDPLPRLSEVWIFEVKYRSSSTFYFDKEEVEMLQLFEEVFGANARIAIRFNANKSFSYNDTSWYLATPEDLEYTDTKAKVEYHWAEQLPTVESLRRETKAAPR